MLSDLIYDIFKKCIEIESEDRMIIEYSLELIL